ncbi:MULTISPECIES: orotidine-5'-phosphate decarboxylase [Roseomonadaceae]|uniref:Orotidine 5'-phosphate decarboxylase n=1 Tax=Falsiroseomonas oleicola TaxID=2801474 RepID=A0ABS6H8Q0_9PROT|nr:orotidine-5'-phosphate decarboxylase [Roseomonas oleicola]MBU8544348.1 orotidine-5'-phosphate decarboxylase [Roseomonas oleicola]
MRRCGLCVALDAPDLATAEGWADAVAPHAGLLKVGLELFSAEGGAAVRRIATRRPVFLDVKLHDIPNTVAGAVRSLAPLGPAWITIHAAGGPAMVEAARKAAEAAGGVARPRILAVTVLTSIDAATLSETGVSGGPVQQVLRLARLAMAAGADGLVCSPREVAPIRDALGELPVLVVPGVRPAGSAADDQARTATPEQVARDGADWIVVGRPITQAADPAEAAWSIAQALRVN